MERGSGEREWREVEGCRIGWSKGRRGKRKTGRGETEEERGMRGMEEIKIK